MRFIFALMVLYSHSFELQPSDQHKYILALFAPNLSWGSVGVDGFFLLSGALIVESWLRTPQLGDFLRKRILRIVPGYLVAVALSVLVIGWIAPVEPGFFRHLSPHFLVSVLVLYAPLTPDAFAGLSNHSVNGSLWTITYEFRCYLLVALFGVASLLRKRWPWLMATAFLFIVGIWPAFATALTWKGPLLILGDPKFYFRLVPIFLIGGCFALFRDRIVYRATLAALSFFLMVLTSRFGEPFFALFFGYIIFYLASLPWPLRSLQKMPDISYGLYLYGWPVGCSILYFLHTGPLVTFASSVMLATVFGWLSWHYVERPALEYKHGRQVALPPG